MYLIKWNFPGEDSKEITKHSFVELKDYIDLIKHNGAENLRVYSYTSGTEKDISKRFLK